MKELDRCRRAGMVGLKLHTSFEREPYVSSRFQAGLGVLRAAQMAGDHSRDGRTPAA